MARTVCTYGTLNLNDGTYYALLPGFHPGEKQKGWDEIRSYAGSVAQLNVSEAYLIQMAVPLRILGSSLADLDSKVAALNTLIDAGAQTLVHGSTSYPCVESPRVGYVRDELAVVAFTAFVVFTPWRTP